MNEGEKKTLENFNFLTERLLLSKRSFNIHKKKLFHTIERNETTQLNIAISIWWGSRNIKGTSKYYTNNIEYVLKLKLTKFLTPIDFLSYPAKWIDRITTQSRIDNSIIQDFGFHQSTHEWKSSWDGWEISISTFQSHIFKTRRSYL